MHLMTDSLEIQRPEEKTDWVRRRLKALKIGWASVYLAIIAPGGTASEMVFGWFKSEQREWRRKIRLDRKHLKARSRRFLRRYLNADETLKPQFYRAVEEMSKCLSEEFLNHMNHL